MWPRAVTRVGKQGMGGMDHHPGDEPTITSNMAADATNYIAIRLGIIVKCATIRAALRQLCDTMSTVRIVCELSSTAGAAPAVEQARAVVVLLGPAIAAPECLRLQGDLAD